jgi:hypothetical protein
MIVLNLDGINLNKPDMTELNTTFEEHSNPSLVATTLHRLLRSANYHNNEIKRIAAELIKAASVQ